MWPIERRRRLYSPECVEGVSLLKNLLHARFVPRLGAKRASFGGFRARFVVAISSGRLFQQAGVFSEVRLNSVLRSSAGYGRILGDGSGSGKRSSNGKASSVSRSVSDRAAAFGAYRREARLGTLGPPPGRGHRPVVPLEQGGGAALRRADGELVDARGRQVAGLRGVERRATRAGRAVLGRSRGRGVRGDRLGVVPVSF